MSVVSGSGRAMEPQRDREGSLVHVVETLLDKGLVLNADIMVSVAGVELLGIRIRAALASFETAARYGLEFPSGTDTDTIAWNDAIEPKDTCPECGKRAPTAQLLGEFCPWCGWKSAQALEVERHRELSGTAQQQDETGTGRPQAESAAGQQHESGTGGHRERATGPDD